MAGIGLIRIDQPMRQQLTAPGPLQRPLQMSRTGGGVQQMHGFHQSVVGVERHHHRPLVVPPGDGGENRIRLHPIEHGLEAFAVLRKAHHPRRAGEGSDYALAVLDGNWQVFDGSKTCKLHLPPNVPVSDFREVTLYDTQTCPQLQTSQKFPAVDSQSEA
jgi:hypothetical protein